MSTMFPPQSLSRLVDDELDTLKLRLAEHCAQCETVAKERENTLQEEIEGLRKENSELLSKLKNEQDGAKEQKLVPKVEETVAVGKSSDMQEIKLVNLDEIVEEAPAAHTGHFELLPELISDQWTGDERVEDHRGAYFERDHHIEKEKKGWADQLLFDPASTFKLCWDIFGIPILAWDLITIPMQVFVIGATGEEVLKGAGWVTLLFWTIDIPVTFRTGYFDVEGDLVMDERMIRRRYLHGSFCLDLLIIMGDWLTVLIDGIGSSAPGFLSNLAVLRVLRIARFSRLLRIKKLKAMIQNLEDCTDNEFMLVVFNLAMKIVSILLINHYVGCGWFFLGGNSSDQSEYRWLGAIPYPQYDYKYLDADGVEQQRKMTDASWHYQYTTSLHWAIAQFTPGPQNIQPQNSFERVYVVFILLFGMVVFSSFIASVTQARMQMAKLMSKFERDTWLLRKFCRQNGISRALQVHMRRYIDLVVIPNYHKLTINEIVLMPKLSAHLRAQVTAELVSKTLNVHPFFDRLFTLSEAIMLSICNESIEKVSLARGDVAFIGGSVAQCMFFVTGGCLDYIPLHKHFGEMKVEKGQWCCEAVLWTKWTHQGQLQASIESTATGIHGTKFRKGLQDHGLIMPYVRAYGLKFCELLSQQCADNNHPTDLHMQASLDVNMADCVGTGNFVWFGLHKAMQNFIAVKPAAPDAPESSKTLPTG